MTDTLLRDVSVTELFRRAEAGEQVAWNAIVDRYTRLVWSVARAHRLRDADAADVVQTTWMRLVEHFGRIENPACLPAWLTTTARRESLRILRQSGRQLLTDDEHGMTELADDNAAALDARLLTEERDAILWNCFRQLSRRCQVLLRVLMATPPPDYASVSAALGMKTGSIGPTRGRCLAQLRKLVTSAGLTAESETQGAR